VRGKEESYKKYSIQQNKEVLVWVELLAWVGFVIVHSSICYYCCCTTKLFFISLFTRLVYKLQNYLHFISFSKFSSGFCVNYSVCCY